MSDEGSICRLFVWFPGDEQLTNHIEIESPINRDTVATAVSAKWNEYEPHGFVLHPLGDYDGVVKLHHKPQRKRRRRQRRPIQYVDKMISIGDRPPRANQVVSVNPPIPDPSAPHATFHTTVQSNSSPFVFNMSVTTARYNRIWGQFRQAPDAPVPSDSKDATLWKALQETKAIDIQDDDARMEAVGQYLNRLEMRQEAKDVIQAEILPVLQAEMKTSHTTFQQEVKALHATFQQEVKASQQAIIAAFIEHTNKTIQDKQG